MHGHRNPDTGGVALSPGRWITRPEHYVMVGMQGVLSKDGRRFSGQRTNPTCGRFDLSR